MRAKLINENNNYDIDIFINMPPEKAFIKAAELGKLTKVKELLSHEAIDNHCHHFALRGAVEHNNYNVAKFLLDNGAGVHDYNGYIFWVAEIKGLQDMFELLKQYA